MSPQTDVRVIDELIAWTASWTGYSPDAIGRAAIRNAVAERLGRGGTMDDILRRASAGDPVLVNAMFEAVSVGETFFFRHPEHFAAVTSELYRWRSQPVLNVWSAGCATGEEAYSLAACLAANAGPTKQVRVLGTDLLERHVEVARAGAYGQWSRRASTPLLYPLFSEPAAADRNASEPRPFRIREELRSLVQFKAHNLLDEPPTSPSLQGFDIVFCRNVLLYFSHESSRAACARIASAVAPGGIVLFGTLDVMSPPAGLVKLGPPELSMFARPLHTENPTHSLRPAPRLPSVSPVSWRDETWDQAIALHLRALVFVERGQRACAEQMLSELRAKAPDYLPGLFEQALLYVRRDDHPRATACMEELVRRVVALPSDALVPGPEDLSIEYYRVAAKAYLNGKGDGEKP